MPSLPSKENVGKFTWDSFTIVKRPPAPKRPDPSHAKFTSDHLTVVEPSKKKKKKHLTHREKLALLLGGEGSGNFGHAGRPGEVGGSDSRGAGAADAPVLQGVNSKANADTLVEANLADLALMTGHRPTPDELKAAETELRALPLVHGTSVAGALGAIDEGLLSHADMQRHEEEFRDDVKDLREELSHTKFDIDNDELGGDLSGWDAEELQRVYEMDRPTAVTLAGKIHELADIQKVLEGTTYKADEKMGLDRFVFMTHGQKHRDYGTVGVVIDNAIIKDGFATERDIAAVPDPAQDQHPLASFAGEEYSPERVAVYQKQIVKGDDYYRVAASRAGNPDMLAHRSRDQLFEIKAPTVPKSAVKGFVVDNLDDAQRLADRLASKGMKGKVLYADPMSSLNAVYLHRQMKAIQQTGGWDEDLAAERDKDTGESGATFILRFILDQRQQRHDLGGEGSGNFGHAGRPGEVGGSAGISAGIHDDGTVTLLHGTSKLNAEAILKEGFKEGQPQTVAGAVEKEYGLPDGSVLNHETFSFAKRRGDLDKAHFTTDEWTANQYTVPEVLQDALHAAWSLQNKDVEGPQGPIARREWVRKEAARLTQPRTLAITVPWSVIGQHAFGKVVTLEEFKKIGGKSDDLFNVSIPVKALKGLKVQVYK